MVPKFRIQNKCHEALSNAIFGYTFEAFYGLLWFNYLKNCSYEPHFQIAPPVNSYYCRWMCLHRYRW